MLCTVFSVNLIYNEHIGLKVIGDSIIANSLRVTDEGVLEESHSFEICAATIPATQLCMRIEKTHHTHISKAKVSLITYMC